MGMQHGIHLIRRWSAGALLALLLAPPAWAGFTVQISGESGFNAPPALPNLRTVNFDAVTLAGEVSASRLTTGGTAMTFPGTGQPPSFTSKYGQVDSGTGASGVTSTINFLGGGTSYVGMLWATSVDNQNTLKITVTHDNGSTAVLSNCQSSTTGCVGGYVPGFWLTDLIAGLLGLVFGSGAPSYDTVYLNYTPPAGRTIAKVDLWAQYYNNCFLIFCSKKSQYVWIDNLSYVDATAPVPHHLEVTTTSASAAPGADVVFTIRACANAACSSLFTTGVTGNLVISGVTPTYPGGQSFSIPAGSSSVTKTVSMTAGTATASLSTVSPAPSNSPSLFCGMGALAASGNSCNLTIASALHHLELTAPANSALTCSPVTFTVRACENAACTVQYTGGVTGKLLVTGTGLTVNYPGTQDFVIAPGASSTTISAHVTKTGTATASLTNLSVSPSGSPQLYCGMGAAAASGGSCSYTLNGAGLLFSVGHHRSNVSQAVTVSAVRSSDNATACTPAFASVSKAVTFKCSYTNPGSGTMPVRVGGTALNSTGNAAMACDGTGRSVSLSFNASGVASTTVQYADAGTVGLSAAYTGSGSDADLSMTGNTSFTAVPAGFALANLTTGNIAAGSNFSARINAVNSTGAITPNFGRETSAHVATLAFQRRAPTGTAAVSGTFSGSVGPFLTNGGHASTSNLNWTEVGRGDLGATLTGSNYLATGLSVTGTTCANEGETCVLPAGAVATVFYGANASFAVLSGVSGSVTCSNVAFGNPIAGVAKHCSYTVTGGVVGSLASATGALGPFIPHHFTVATTQGCGAFTYSGQPFTAVITARNAAGAITENFDGSALTTPNQATAVTLVATTNGGTGSFNGTGAVAASRFSAGVATATTPVFTFTQKLTALDPGSPDVAVRATNADGVSSAGHAEGAVTLRSGRLKISNVFGTDKASIGLPIQGQYWSGRAWVLNDLDNCTSIASSAVALSNYRDHKGAASAAWSTSPPVGPTVLVAGHGTMTFSAPSPGGAGSVDVALNLGSLTADQSCLSIHPVTAGAARPWLRSQYGSTGACAAAFDRDPSARLTFGVYSPESKKTIYGRESF